MPRARKPTRAELAREQMYRDLVLECAERVFARRGVHAAKMQDIAAEAGISLSTLYGVFEGKSDVVDALHAWRGEQFLERVARALDAPGPAREVVWHAIRAYCAFLLEHLDYFWVDLREGRSWAIGDVESNPEFQKALPKWRDALARGAAEGAFRADSPDKLATVVNGLLQVCFAAALRDAADVDALDPDAVAREIADCVERLVCTPAALAAPGPWLADARASAAAGGA